MRFPELRLLLATLSVGLSAPAATEVPARVGVWYRSSEGCPDGQSFVQRLNELGRPAALAGVGDRVDFVVTLAAHGESSAGRLERQTERGTVAIREVEAPVCADVAEALALTLELTLEPTPTAVGETSTAASATTAAVSETSAAAGENAAVATATAEREPARPAPTPPVAREGLRFGARLSLASGIAPELAPGAALFAELPAGPAELRLTLHGAHRRSRVDAFSLGVTLLGGELDACGWALHADALSIAPCLGVDVGMIQASSSGSRARSARGSWAAALAMLRGQWQLWPALAPELQLAAVVPMVRYVFGAPEADDLFRIRTIGVELSVGARWSP